MCQNYRDGKCLVGNKNCRLKEEGEDAKQGDCELHGDYDVWNMGDKIIVTNTGVAPENAKEALGLGLNFLTADEWAYKRGKKLEIPTEYITNE